MITSIKMKIPWSASVIIITILVAILLAYTEMTLMRSIIATGSIYKNFIALFVIIVVAFFVLMIPRYIQMGDTSLVLKKVCGRVVICYNQILEIEPYKLSGDVRVFGSGGFGGFLGLFFNPKKGKYFAYVTHPAHIVFITTKNGKKYAFSCSNAELLVETIKKLENENIHL